MKVRDTSMVLYREIEEQVNNIHNDAIGSVHCIGCEYQVRSEDDDGVRVTCSQPNPMRCVFTAEVVAQLTSDLEVCLRELNFD